MSRQIETNAKVLINAETGEVKSPEIHISGNTTYQALDKLSGEVSPFIVSARLTSE